MYNQNLLDSIALVSFILGLANYDENVSQSLVQELIDKALGDIHNHLEQQDIKMKAIEEKLDKLLEVLTNDI